MKFDGVSGTMFVQKFAKKVMQLPKSSSSADSASPNGSNKNKVTLFDGALGTELQAMGSALSIAISPSCVWNLERPDCVLKTHISYLEAGARIITANTFSANPWILSDRTGKAAGSAGSGISVWPHKTNGANGGESAERMAERCCVEGMRLANQARRKYKGSKSAFELGPSGRLMEPYGDLSMEDAIDGYAACVAAVMADRSTVPDLFLLETFTDPMEAKAAILAIKRVLEQIRQSGAEGAVNHNIPIYASCSFEKNGRLMSGESPQAAAVMLESLGAAAVGANCGFGLEETLPIVKDMVEAVSVPVFAMPNAGLPETADGKIIYTLSPDEFAEQVVKLIDAGCRMVGGCCGTGPAHIAALARETKEMQLPPVLPRDAARPAYISGGRKLIMLDGKPRLVADRILPLPQDELVKIVDSGDFDRLADAVAELAPLGARAVNIDIKGAADEAGAYAQLIPAIQQLARIPLCIDTDSPAALDAALTRYRGRAIINSLDCSPECLQAFVPIYKKHGGLLIIKLRREALPPKTPELRLELARETLSALTRMGVNRHDVVFDPVVMPVRTHMSSLYSADNTTRLLHDKLGTRVALGVSNYSRGKKRRALREMYFLATVLNASPDLLFVNLRSPQVRACLCDEGLLRP